MIALRISRALPTLRLGGFALLCSLTAACDRPAGGLAAPESLVMAPDASILEAKGGKASGSVEVHGTPAQNVKDQRYSFIAVSTGLHPTAKGQVEVHSVRFTGEEITVHAAVTCLSILGDQAWGGSRITRVVVDGQEVPGRVDQPMIFRVRDLGEGTGITDVASLVFFMPVGSDGDLVHCTTRPDFPILRESVIGNIQVKPE